MAFENLFIRTEKFIGGVKLDAVLTESHSNLVRISKNPIELGADVTDHSIIEPKKVNIQAEITDSPVGFAAVEQIVDSITGLFGTATSENLTRSQSAYNTLIALQEAREPIEIQTKLKLYQNMIITNISTSQDKDTSRMVRLSIDAEEIVITESEVVELSADNLEDGETKEQATPPEDRGRQETSTPDDTTNKSVLKSTLDWIGA